MRKLIIGVSFAVGCFLAMGSTHLEAAGAARGAKTTVNVSYTTTVSTVAAGTAVAVYSVVMSTGAAGEFIALFDTSAVGGITSGNTSVVGGFKTRLYYSSTTANTTINFDPPLQFNSGLIVAPSAVTGQSLFTYEKGRVTQGY